MKKFSLLLTAFVMILTLFIPNLTMLKLSQMSNLIIGQLKINYLSDKGIINGTPEGTFKPGDDVTRGQTYLNARFIIKISKTI